LIRVKGTPQAFSGQDFFYFVLVTLPQEQSYTITTKNITDTQKWLVITVARINF